MYPALTIFGWLFIAAMLAVVIIPWATRKADLFTSWNLFLIGSANFVGFDSVASGSGAFQWGIFSSSIIYSYIIAASVFYLFAFLAYYCWKFPRKQAGKRLRMWPRAEGNTLIPMLLLCLMLAVWGIATPNIEGVAQLGYQLGVPATVLAATFVTVNWLRRPFNGTLALVWISVFAFALVMSVFGTTGRRSILSVFLILPICLYWMILRYKLVRVTAIPLAFLCFLVYSLVAAHNEIRHRYMGKASYMTPAQEAVETIKLLPTALFNTRGPMRSLPSGSVDASMICMQIFPRDFPTEPFACIKFILANPIPRVWWPDKPSALGSWLSRRVPVWYQMGEVNISMGVVGHGYHEGGMHMLIFYGLLLGGVMRFFDELLIRQSDNPFLLGILAASSGNIIGLSRGDLALFMLLILGTVICTLVLRFVGRIFGGYSLVYPSDEERAQMVAQQQYVPDYGQPEQYAAARF
jgi:hypothetical protein